VKRDDIGNATLPEQAQKLCGKAHEVLDVNQLGAEIVDCTLERLLNGLIAEDCQEAPSRIHAARPSRPDRHIVFDALLQPQTVGAAAPNEHPKEDIQR